MPQACREAVHELNYTPSDTQSTSYSPPPRSLSLYVALSVYKVKLFLQLRLATTTSFQGGLNYLGFLISHQRFYIILCSYDADLDPKSKIV